jgi:X-Pro dipeptidyl-peptidase
MKTPMPLLVLALLLLAGCVAPGAQVAPASTPLTAGDLAALAASLSPRLGELDILHETLDVETSHGLVNVDLYLPDVPEGTKLPLILVASPYNNPNSPLALGAGGKSGEDEWISLPLYEWIRAELIPRGYAFAQMDILGTRNSGGCMGIMDETERQATAQTIDALAAMPWSDGKVGMIGKSYLGLSQLGAAVEKPEALVTIVPIAPPTHDYAYHYYNGVPYAANHATNFLYYGAYSLPPPDGDLAAYAARYPERVPCSPEAMAGGFYTLGDYSERWQARDYRPLIPQIDPELSVFFVAGHQDWNVKPDHPVDVFHAIPGPKLMLVGQWGHDYPNINNVDEERWGEREEWYLTLHRWFDHFLKGIDTGLLAEIAACPVQTQDYAGAWRCAESFPPQDASTLTLHPDVGGALGPEPGEGSAQMPDVETDVAADMPSQASYRYEVAEATRIFGVPQLLTRVSTTSGWNAHVHAALGVERDSGIDEVTWGFQSLRHRDGLEAGNPFIPGDMYELSFGLYPIDLVLEPGDTLVLTLRGVNANAAAVLMLPNPQPGLLTFDLAETTLHLPLASIDDVFVPPAQGDVPAEYQQED